MHFFPTIRTHAHTFQTHNAVILIRNRTLLGRVFLHLLLLLLLLQSCDLFLLLLLVLGFPI